MYSNEQKQAIAALLRKALADSGLTDTEWMRRHSISQPTYFNQVKNGKWGEYPKQGYWQQLADVLGFAPEKTYWQIFEFPHYNNVRSLCRRAHETAGFYLLDGNTGNGKSTALREYMRQPEVQLGKVWYYRHSDRDVTDREMTIQLLKTVGVRKAEGKDLDKANKPALMRTLIAALRDAKNTDSLLLIDEMEYCSNPCLQAIRKLIYETEGSVGMVLCGAGLFERMHKLAHTRTALQNGWAQFWSRLSWNAKRLEEIGWDKGLPTTDPRNAAWLKTVKATCENLGIADKEAIAWIARNTTNYRDLGHIVPKALEIADRRKLPLSLDLLQALSDSTLYIAA